MGRNGYQRLMGWGGLGVLKCGSGTGWPPTSCGQHPAIPHASRRVTRRAAPPCATESVDPPTLDPPFFHLPPSPESLVPLLRRHRRCQHRLPQPPLPPLSSNNGGRSRGGTEETELSAFNPSSCLICREAPDPGPLRCPPPISRARLNRQPQYPHTGALSLFGKESLHE
ncbi:hypothetical protein SETIT_8G047000v2 [Setaria italica]|uniref:Uncharacterized protein n=1 Tax=Setaria italica TaxID=4555 RepID=A0A368S486_SETIT|nr:hypothetical protein SETIT_8G047000v2 [Setaria italica]